MSNRLANETSPYLQQHADNPVDWYPWGAEALDLAKSEDKPILLSIGYAACHWCHVMAHESFEDEATAAVMNARFVNIKVDREERPDIDGIYMHAVQALTGHGGWPMTMFLTPEGAPFYGGTYFPPHDRQGMPSFRKVLASVSDAYTNRRDSVATTSAQLSEIYKAARAQARSDGPVNAHTLELAYRGIARHHDVRHGGFDSAPKFPQTMSLDFLLRYWKRTDSEYALEIAHDSFRKMARGGIYDQVGGGFHRYTVDAIWLVPHFEKMLYDNALLVRLGAHLWQATHDAEVRRVTEETVFWLAREMTSADGGFYSSLDADSEGHEGKFYVWSEKELDELLGNDAPAVKAYYGVTAGGNFEGQSILYVRADAASAAARQGISQEMLERILRDAKTTLYDTRAKRIWPGLDDKILASWNGLMLTAFAEAARVLDREDYVAVAETNAEFVLSQLRGPAGRLLRTWKGGEAKFNGYLEDYALYAEGLLELFQTTFDQAWFDAAVELADLMLAHFTDPASGFFDTSDDHEQLLFRPKETQDGAMPSGGSVAAMVLAKLGAFTGDTGYSDAAEAALASMRAEMSRAPLGYASWLSTLDFVLSDPSELAIVGADPLSMLRLVRSTYRPHLVVAAKTGDDDRGVPLLTDRGAVGGATTAYLCRHFACERPVTSAEDLAALLHERL